jgi:type II secretion system protein N
VRKKLPVIILASIPVLFWMIWIALPETAIQTIIEDSVAGSQFEIEVQGLKKGLFYSVDIDAFILKGRRGELISVKNIRSYINPLFIPLFQLRLTGNGTVGDGNISGNLTLSKGKIKADVSFQKVGFSDLYFLKLTGIKGKGTLSGSFTISKSGGHAEFVSRDAVFEETQFSGVKAPLNIFHVVTGSIDLSGNAVEVVSLAFQGEDIYARLKGDIMENVMNISMELMPGKSYIENPFVLAGLEAYKIAPGYYIIPVKGNFFP